jgi:hypothetical protein
MAATKDPNKLEPAYLITLAVIVALGFILPNLGRNTAKASKAVIPAAAVWTVKLTEGQEHRTTSRVAMQVEKWRMEVRYPDSDECVVAVFDGQRYASNNAMAEGVDIEKISPVKQLQLLADAFNSHQKPDPQTVDGVFCWHAKGQTGHSETDIWIDAKTNFPKRVVSSAHGGRRLTQDYDRFEADLPNITSLFDRDLVSPLLAP